MSIDWKFNPNTAVSPATDFYKHVNDNWLAANPLPDDYQRFGSFEVLHTENQKKVKDILDNSAENTPDILLYRLGMDENTLNQQKFSPIQETLSKIKDASDKQQLYQVAVVDSIKSGLQTFLNFYVSGDVKNSKHNIVYVVESGLGLPDRDYYLEEDKADTLVAYRLFLMTLFNLAGLNTDDLVQAVDLEVRLAKARLTKVEKRDPHKVYNPMSTSDLQLLIPDFKLSEILPEGKLSVYNPEFIKEVSKIWQETDIETLKTYAIMKVLQDSAPYLHDEAYNAHFQLFGVKMSGQISPKPRWKRVQSSVDSQVGEILGKSYVDKYFTQEAKDKALAMVEQLRTTLRDRVTKLTWMEEATKVKALAKLEKFKVKIGYPTKWRNYEDLDLSKAESFFGALQICENFEFGFQLAKAYQPVDPTEWLMSPHQVNAYYHPINNEIVFPAGILQEPFFNPNQSDGANFGAIGAVIGHEMTHGFDDQGRKFDSDGEMNDWWTEKDAEAYVKKTDVIKQQFGAFELEGHKVNPDLTQGENIADIGGLKIAFLALQDFHGKDVYAKEEGNEFSQAQEFFMAWSRAWCAHIRPEESIKRLTTDPHSPNYFRVNGVVGNIPEFYKAFGLNIEDKSQPIRPVDLAEVW